MYVANGGQIARDYACVCVRACVCASISASINSAPSGFGSYCTALSLN